MIHNIIVWTPIAVWLILFMAAVLYGHHMSITMRPVPATALSVFLEEDVWERTVRETGINPAAVDTVLPKFVWPS